MKIYHVVTLLFVLTSCLVLNAKATVSERGDWIVISSQDEKGHKFSSPMVRRSEHIRIIRKGTIVSIEATLDFSNEIEEGEDSDPNNWLGAVIITTTPNTNEPAAIRHRLKGMTFAEARALANDVLSLITGIKQVGE